MATTSCRGEGTGEIMVNRGKLSLLDDELKDEHLVPGTRAMDNEGNELEGSDEIITHVPLMMEDFLQAIPTENLEDKVLLSGWGNVKERTEIAEVGNEDVTTRGAGNQETVTKDNRELRRSLRERKASQALTDFVRF
ncbi:hypothetical protein GOBAR_DD10632 [Gossypium barbadense]|nr:hypothetical protein GOBAR_DD10632 [Gossypium barbadense]